MPRRVATLALALLLLPLAGCLLEPAPADPTPRPTTPTPAVVTPPTHDWPSLKETDGAWRVARCAWGEGTTAAPPDLLVAVDGPGGDVWLRRLSWQEGQYAVAREGEVFLAKPEPFVAPYAVEGVGGEVFAYGGTRGDGGGPALLRLDTDLRVAARREVGAFASMAAHEGVLYVAGHSLRTFDRDLNLLDEVELPLKESWAGKMAHDLIVHDGTAYLIDDVVMPLYVLRVDVRDPRDLRVIDRQEIHGGHLPGHWIDARNARWFVLQQWGGRGGGHESLHPFPLGPGEAEEPWRLHAFQSGWIDGGNATDEGFGIRALLDREPQWVIAASMEGARFGRLEPDLDAKALDFCQHPLDLPIEGEAPPSASLDRGAGFVAGAYGRTLFLVDEAADPPVRVVAQRVDFEPRLVRVLPTAPA